MDFYTLLSSLNLGSARCPPRLLEGGLIHETYEVLTEQGHFVLKMLNPLLMQKPEAKARYAFTEKVAADFAAQGIPAVCALEHNRQILQHVGNRFVLIYPWIQGKQRYYPDLSIPEISKIAGILAKMHILNVSFSSQGSARLKPCQIADIELNIPQFCRDWTALKAFPDLFRELDRCLEAKTRLCHDKMVISHRDLDPKNVLWKGGDCFIIDWESADWIHPMEELIALAFEWSGFDQGQHDKVYFQIFIKAYEEAGGQFEAQLLQDSIYAYMANYLGWLAFNLERREQDSLAEQKQAQQQIEKTLQKIDFLIQFVNCASSQSLLQT